MPRYYRTFLATGLLTAMTLPALAQTPAPAPTSVSPAPTAPDTTKPTAPATKHHVTHRHHTAAVKKTPATTN